MENTNPNSNLPDTQLLESQNDVCTDQSIYAADEYMQAWATMMYLPTKTALELRQEKAWFGRDDPIDSTNMKVWIFTKDNCRQVFLEKISKCHFMINRDELTEEEKKKLTVNKNPAFITCHGRNGLYLNDEKLLPDERRILNQDDVIKLTKSYPLFEFKYVNWDPALLELPQECVRKYYVGAELGQGGCGVVRLCFNTKTFEKFAIKMIRKETNRLAPNAIATNAKILNEVQIMKKISHPHVLSLIDFYDSPQNVAIIMDYLEGKDMLHRITQFDPNHKRLSEPDAKFFFLQACQGLKYLHDRKIIHRDIKPDNILLQSLKRDTVLKISDFGLSKLFVADTMQTVCGTELYVAPEVFTGKYTNKVDIWSLGCVLYAMLSGTVPFHNAPGLPDIMVQIKNAQFSFRDRAWNYVSRSAKHLICQMLQKKSKDRPTIEEVLDHTWLQCEETKERVEKLFRSNDSTLDSSLEQTLVNVSLNDSCLTIASPPAKRRRFN